MIKFELYKLEQTGYECDHPKCTHDLKYHWNVIGNKFHLKTDQTVLIISHDDYYEVYCRDCINLLYKEWKPLLDSKLWAFQ